MTNPLITIGITCYREGDWLRECWESVLAQTDDRWEAVLVMDGGSDARTREVFEEIEHPSLRKYAFAENVGPYPARNKAFELTRTPYHFYLDADDQLVPDSVMLMLNTFDAHPEASIVYGDVQFFGVLDSVHRYLHRHTPDDLVEGRSPLGACAYRKELWERLGGFAQELARGRGDYDFLIGAAEAGAVAVHCGEVYYRRREGRADCVGASYQRQYHRKAHIVVRRHPAFFRDTRRRHRFLALGYARASMANYRAGDVWRAALLGAGALAYGLRRGKLMAPLRAARALVLAKRKRGPG